MTLLIYIKKVYNNYCYYSYNYYCIKNYNKCICITGKYSEFCENIITILEKLQYHILM